MFYLVQENIFREHHYQLLIDLLEKHKFDYEVVKYIPFEHEIEFTTNRKDVWLWGSVSMARYAEKYNWNPGSMYNSNHDFEVYSRHYNMLNDDGVIIKLTDELPKDYGVFFARPTLDTKSFNGKVFNVDTWKELTDRRIEAKKDLDIFVFLAPLKHIQQEVRCWVVNGKIITASRYKIGSLISYFNYDDEKDFINFAQSMVDKFQPAKAFVIDICLSNDKYKVVEINCINCAGFYAANMYKLIEALEETFN